jgi:K+-sensing histidine kinase KdpD
MSAGSGELFLVRLSDITKNILTQRLMWTFQDQVSHKLKTPLTKLTGFIELLREELSPPVDTDEYFLLTAVDQNARQLQEEIMSVFHYMNTVNLNKPGRSDCRLAELPRIIAEIQADLELGSIDMSSSEIVETLGAMKISLSCQALELILWELVKNAKKFHPEQSPQLEIKIFRVAAGISIQVRDDGLTLSPEQLSKMWAPYYQAEKFFSGQVPGMGLGLSMVASLVWGIGGACRSYNREDGPGIVVELVLPVSPDV